MRPEIENILPILAGLAFLAVLAMLRTLAIFRQRQVEAHDVAREAVQMRRDYEQQERQRLENPIEA
jgi:galactokinase/mevalonate kinase-like predicted kinase